MSEGDLSEGEYEIERILDHRKKGGRTEYLIRWKDFDSEEDEWIDEENINGQDIIDTYYDTLDIIKQTPARKVLSKFPGKQEMISESAHTQSQSYSTTQTTRKGTTTRTVVESEFSDVEMLDDAPVITKKSVRTETIQERSGTGNSTGRTSDFSVSNKTTKQKVASNKSKFFDLSACDVPLIIFLSCMLFIMLSFVFESFKA